MRLPAPFEGPGDAFFNLYHCGKCNKREYFVSDRLKKRLTQSIFSDIYSTEAARLRK